MKKIILTATLIIVLGLGLGADMGKELYYANISFVVWKLNNGPHEAAKVIGTPMPKVFKDSWIYDLVSMDVSDGNPNMKILEKDGFRFILTAESGRSRLSKKGTNSCATLRSASNSFLLNMSSKNSGERTR